MKHFYSMERAGATTGSWLNLSINKNNAPALSWTLFLLISLLTISTGLRAGVPIQPIETPSFAPMPAPACSLSVTTVMDSSVSCNGLSDGGATTTVSGGVTPYTYAWSNSASTASITGLAAGTYYVTITDSASCQIIDTITITQPQALVATAKVDSNVFCFGDLTGKASVTATGGSAPPSPGSAILITEINTNSPDYLEIMNVSGATVDVTGMKVVISNSYSAINTINTTTWNLSGTMASGAIEYREDVTTNNKYWGNNMFWSSGNNSWAILIDSTGKILDCVFWGWSSANISSFSITVSGKSVTLGGAWTGNGVNASCSTGIQRKGTKDEDKASDWSCASNTKGTKNASLTTPFQGLLSYNYSWSTGDTLSFINGQAVGSYTVTVSDSAGCSDTSTITILGPPAAVSAVAQVDSNVSCKGFKNGIASATGSGGWGKYTYSWNNGEKTSTISGLDTGTYIVTISDSLGCSSMDTVTVTQPAGFTVTTNVDSNVTGCFGNTNGQATINPSGGIGAYSYQWSTGDTTKTLSGLGAGTYYITVNDQSACPEWDTVTITQPTSIILTTQMDSAVSCNGLSDGVGKAISSGGTGSHTYSWSNTSTGPSASGLAAGTHYVTVTDGNGCTLSDSVVITEPKAISVTFNIDSIITCHGYSNGQITGTASGGTAGSGGTLLITEVGAGSPDYIEIMNVGKSAIDVTGMKVVVSNNYTNISTRNNVTWNLNGTMASGAIDYREDVTSGGKYWGNNLFWNPGSNSWAIIIDSNGTILDALFWGWDSASIANFSINVSGKTVTNGGAWVGPGVVASCSNGFTRGGTEDSNKRSDFSCSSSTKGTKNTSLTTPFAGSYEWAWSSLDSASTIDSLSTGTYTVTITDNEGCTLVDSVTIGEPAKLVATATVVQDVSCFGFRDGKASVNTTGGTGSYSYSWSNGTSADSISQVPGNVYYVTVTDSLNCESIDSADVHEPSQLIVGLDSIFHPECNGDATGYIRMGLNGGTRPFTFQWGHGSTDSVLTGQGPGIYFVTITHANGCTDWQNYQLLQKDITHPTAIGNDQTVYLDNLGTAVITLNDVDNGSFDNCGLHTLSLSKATFSCSDTGLNRVVLFAFDSSGNQGTDTINVMVHDTITPAFDFCPSDTIICRDDNLGNTYAYPVMKGSDNCTFTITQTSGLGIGHLYPRGLTTNSYVVTDASGNSRTCSWDIRVGPTPVVDLGEDQEICGANKVTLKAPGNSTVIQWQNGSSDTVFVVPDDGSGQIIVTVQDSVSTCSNTDTVQITYHANCLSVSEPLANQASIRYFPNPTQGSFTLHTEGLSGPVSLTITDVNGRVIKELSWEDGSTLQNVPLELYEVENGTYLLLLEEQRGQAVHRINLNR